MARIVIWQAVVVVVVGALGGCASRPINPPLAEFDPNTGYRSDLRIAERENNDRNLLFVLSFSGGGTRAAALSYGLLEELRRTEIVVDGQERRLLDEVDVITGVSGGSFTALSYALYGERLFDEYPERFLNRNVQGALARRTFNPLNWWKLWSRNYGRSDLAAEYYDKILFEGATFADLLERDGPIAIATATDISTGSRLAFYQNDFDLLCSDLEGVHLSRAAATSSAVPVVLSAMTLNNYGGTCGYEYPAWVKVVADAETRVRPSSRAHQRYLEMKSFRNSEERPFIHLVDGGVSDNIGVRGVMESLEELAVSAEFRGEVGFGEIDRIVIVIVNSHSSPPTDWDRKSKPPGMFSQLMQASSVPIERYSFETIESMKDRAAIETWRRDLRVARARLAGATEEEAEASVRRISLNVLDVSFDSIVDPEERAVFMDLPTSFVLPEEEIDRLREIAGRLFRNSIEYSEVMEAVGGRPPELPPELPPVTDEGGAAGADAGDVLP